ncbi:MAG: cobaltochelatase subunit CobN, partial [Pseudomonadota bacterium]
MHLLATKPGNIHDGDEAIDLGQTPGDIVILSAADTDILSLDQAQEHYVKMHKTAARSLRLANIMRLAHPYSIDLYVESIIAHAKIIIVRCLGGRSYWTYGIDEIHRHCKAQNKILLLLPGDNRFDEELHALSLCEEREYHIIWQYFYHGGAQNFNHVITWCNHQSL